MPDDFVDFDDVYELDSVDDFNLDESESPYFDWDNDRMFDEPTRGLIDRIATDPRFDYNSAAEIVDELAPDLGEDKQRCLLRAAQEVFDLTVFPGLEATAQQLVDQALAGPDWDAILACREDLVKRGNYGASYTDSDPRILAIFARRLAGSDSYPDLRKEACARAESEARLIVSEFPRRTRDLLVLASRNADRESLLEHWIEGASQSRRSLTAYYAQRIVREEDEDWVWDRYSAAAKILAGEGWSKKAIADGLGIGVGRVDRLLERTSGQDIADNDPLCDLAIELRGRGDAWHDVAAAPANKPRPFSRLSVAERVTLAGESSDPELLVRLAKQGSRRISEALLTRHCKSGDIGEDILQTLYSKSSWMHAEFIEANHQRPLPKDIVLALADESAHVLFDCDDATALAAKGLGRADFKAVLAVRESDIDTLEQILADLETESLRPLVELLIERPLNQTMRHSSRLLKSLLHTAEKTDDPELGTALRLVACQNPDVMAQHIEAATTGRPFMFPEAIVAVALGSYHLPGRNTRDGVHKSAQELWEAAELTDEHIEARKVVAACGSEAAYLETANNIYVATADAIRSFRKPETIQYTYVHMRITPTVTSQFNGMELLTLGGHPALGYHREMRKHPLDRSGPDVEAIVWPIPFQPAIYSLDIGLGESGGYIAVSGSKVAVIEEL